jgi:1,2-beta-oligoglucan phosphorylase
MFFERERGIRPGDSHGDIVYWPVLALAQYLLPRATPRCSTKPCRFSTRTAAGGERATILAHVERALELIRRRVIPGTVLAAYGHGDWNDSLQPAKPEMRERLCSSWTVTLNYQTFIALADAFRKMGRSAPRELEAEAAASLRHSSAPHRG